MNDIFRPEISFEHIIKDVAARGWAFEIEGLRDGFVKRLARSVAEGPYRPCPADSGGVRQEFEGFSPQPGEYALVDELGGKLGQMVRWGRGNVRNLATWQPNDVSVQRYPTPTSGIGRHRDYKRDLWLVVAVTVAGFAAIKLYLDKDDPSAYVVLETGPGSVLFLAGYGLVEGQDCRKAHEVGPPIGEPRISIGYRQTVQA